MTRGVRKKYDSTHNMTKLTSHRGILNRRREKLKYILKKYKGLNKTIEYTLVQEIYRTIPETIDFDNLTHYNGLFTKKEAESLDLFGELINKYKHTWR